MPTATRSSGITIDIEGEITAQKPLQLRRRGQQGWPGAVPGRPRQRGVTRAPAPAPLTEEEAIVDAFGEQQLELVEAIPLDAPAGPATRSRGVGPRGEVRINVPLRRDETAVVLVERDGVYEWKLDGAPKPPPAKPPGPRSRSRAAVAPQYTHSLSFTIAVPAAPAPAPVVRASRGLDIGGLFKRTGAGKVVAYVFRFIARKVLKGLTRLLERSVREGLVHITSPDPASWTTLADDARLPLPEGRAARVLLLVHGTFSSTLGSYGTLASHAEGQGLLRAALAHYDLVIGWDHRTLSALPTANAIDIVARLEQLGFAQPPQVDAIAFSRGGLVLRSLLEQVLPASPLQLDVRRAVFVACTNGGTELARAANWHRLADRYMNLAAAGARAAALVPGFGAAGAVLAAAVRGVAVLVKSLASAAIDDEGIPGLAAMDPGGEFVRGINAAQPDQPVAERSFYCIVTSNFETAAAAGTDARVMSPTLIQKLADRATNVLYGKPNDLVVHVESMAQIDVALGAFVDRKLEYGDNGRVHHLNYFAQPETAQALQEWLELPAAATPRGTRSVSRSAPAKKPAKKPARKPAKRKSSTRGTRRARA